MAVGRSRLCGTLLVSVVTGNTTGKPGAINRFALNRRNSNRQSASHPQRLDQESRDCRGADGLRSASADRENPIVRAANDLVKQ